MTEKSVTPLDALNNRANELIARLLRLDESQAKLFSSLGDPAKGILKALMEDGHVNRH